MAHYDYKKELIKFNSYQVQPLHFVEFKGGFQRGRDIKHRLEVKRSDSDNNYKIGYLRLEVWKDKNKKEHRELTWFTLFEELPTLEEAKRYCDSCLDEYLDAARENASDALSYCD